MGELRMHALAIDEVREMAGASPDLAGELREVARERFFARAPRKGSLLHLLGPLTLRPIAPPDPDAPTAQDADTLLAGGFLAPDRAVAGWRLLDAWMADRAWGTLRLPLSERERDRLDVDLTVAGVPAELTLGPLLRRDPGLPLRPLAGMQVGHAPHDRALAAADAWRRHADDVDPRSASAARTGAEWLGRMWSWGERAREVGRPTPGVVALWLPCGGASDQCSAAMIGPCTK